MPEISDLITSTIHVDIRPSPASEPLPAARVGALQFETRMFGEGPIELLANSIQEQAQVRRLGEWKRTASRTTD